jgi:hypothetical protein
MAETRKLTEADRYSIANALRLAAQEYLKASNASAGADRVTSYEMAQTSMDFADLFEQAQEAAIT